MVRKEPINVSTSDGWSTSQFKPCGTRKDDYRGTPTTLCQGCGHNSISNQIISAMYELNVLPEDV